MRPVRTDRGIARLFCLLASALLLLPTGVMATQACVLPGSGIGGTGTPQGGIGGTGAPAAGGTGGTGEQAASGVGGTAAVAGGIGGTGIVGTITGFASVCIGELEVHFDTTTPVSMNARVSSLNRLALGQVVAIEAGQGVKGLTARSIAILNALEGPVMRADSARGMLEVMGQQVRLTAGVDASRIAAGTSVRVSGLRDARGVVHATRLEPASDLREASAIGFLRSDGRGANLEGLAIAGAGGAAGSELLVRGNWDGRRLQVHEQRSNPSLPFAGRVRDVVVEGLVHGRSGQLLRISGFDVRLNAAAHLGGDQANRMIEGSRVRVVGRIEAGRRINSDRLEIERSRGGNDAYVIEPGRGGGSDDSIADGRPSGGDSGASSDGSRGADSGGKGLTPHGGRDRGSGDRGGGSGDRSGGSGDRGSQKEKVEQISGKTDKVVKPESGRNGRN